MIHSLGPPYSNWRTFYYVLSNRRNIKYYIYCNSSYNKILQKEKEEIIFLKLLVMIEKITPSANGAIMIKKII
jgi:hypothetical protein